jgi:acyl-CoA thioester hydrolase
MSRIKLDLPEHFNFQCQIKVRIDDINYGNHLSNDAYLKYMHEARMQFLQYLGLSEMDIGGASVIMGDTAIVFKAECFYGDILNIAVTASDFGARSFDIFYLFTHSTSLKTVAEAKTGMVCYDYNSRKTVPVPETFKQLFETQNS